MSGRALVALTAAAALSLVLAGCGTGTASQAVAPAGATPLVVPPTVAPTGDQPAATDAPADEALPAPAGAAPAVDPMTVPVSLSAPTVGIATPLVQLGIATDGSLQVPTDFGLAGWLDRSPVPGARGPAVLAGHVDSRTGPAVFYRLDQLAVGDPVAVVRADGSTVTFHVDGVRRYAKNAFPTAAVYGPAPGPVLRLITCGGSFDRAAGHYRDNVVVYATAD